MGRAGRFGTKGLALTFVATEEDSEVPRVFSPKNWSLLRFSRVVAWKKSWLFLLDEIL